MVAFSQGILCGFFRRHSRSLRECRFPRRLAELGALRPCWARREGDHREGVGHRYWCAAPPRPPTAEPHEPLAPSPPPSRRISRAYSWMVSSATKKTPSSNSSKSSAPTCKPRRVLPMPPAPVRVSTLTPSAHKRLHTSPSSRSRPTSGVGWAGRLFILASRVLNAWCEL